MYTLRPSAHNVTAAELARVYQPGGAAGKWWLGPWPGFPLAAAIDPANCVAAYRAVNTPGSPWGAGPTSIAESYVNLNQPGTYNAAPGVAPTWAAATGWGITTTQYLTTGIVPVLGTTWSMFIRFDYSSGGIYPVVAGARATAYPPEHDFVIVADNGPTGLSNITVMRNGEGAVGISITPRVEGVVGFFGLDAYVNGAFAGNIVSTPYVGNTRQLFIGCLNDRGNPAYYFRGTIQAVVVYNAPFTAQQAAALGTAVTGAMAAL